jgi:hypothetical protein
MVVHARHTDAIGTIRGHSLDILGWLSELQNAKRTGTVDAASWTSIDGLRVKLHDLESDMKESAAVKLAVDCHRWAGGIGYFLLFLILLTLWFPGAGPTA